MALRWDRTERSLDAPVVVHSSVWWARVDTPEVAVWQALDWDRASDRHRTVMPLRRLPPGTVLCSGDRPDNWAVAVLGIGPGVN